ncbi:MAG: lysylphosphatidylglycerol synthase transmembrane domain-containing protein [Vicinamibacterales bacterium]
MKSLRTVAVSLLAVALVVWFLRHANLGDVWREMRSADRGLLLAGTTLFVPMMLIRAIRWRYLMRPIGPVRIRNAWRTTMIGFAASNVLPARIGEVLRPYLLARAEGLNATSAFATIVVERLLDGLAVLALLALYLSGVIGPPPRNALMATVAASSAITAAAILALLVLMAVLSAHPERVGRLVHSTERVLPVRMAAMLARVAERFSHGLGVARAPRLLVVSTVWTFALWLTIATQTWMVSRAFGINMTAGGTFLQQTLLVIGIAMPTPGGVGGFHEAYRIGATTFFRAPNDAAIGAALALHAISFIPTTLLGGLFMLQDGLNVSRLRRLADEGATVTS